MKVEQRLDKILQIVMPDDYYKNMRDMLLPYIIEWGANEYAKGYRKGIKEGYKQGLYRQRIIKVLSNLIPLAKDAIKNPSASSHQEFIKEDKDDIKEAEKLLAELQLQPVTAKTEQAKINKMSDNPCLSCVNWNPYGTGYCEAVQLCVGYNAYTPKNQPLEPGINTGGEKINQAWECPRCHQMHSYLKMSCDCPPATITATTGYCIADQDPEAEIPKHPTSDRDFTMNEQEHQTAEKLKAGAILQLHIGFGNDLDGHYNSVIEAMEEYASQEHPVTDDMISAKLDTVNFKTSRERETAFDLLVWLRDRSKTE